MPIGSIDLLDCHISYQAADLDPKRVLGYLFDLNIVRMFRLVQRAALQSEVAIIRLASGPAQSAEPLPVQWSQASCGA